MSDKLTSTGQPAAPGSSPTPGELKSGQGEEILVWKKDTWGSFGQHDNLYTFVIFPDLTIKPIFEVAQTRHENRDSSKNVHRYTYISRAELSKLEGCILKFVHDYASSRKRIVEVSYAMVVNGDLVTLECTKGLRDAQGFFDEVKLPNGRTLIVRKEGVGVK